ncbi:MAG: cardiolipin synthase [Alphaproteobacteria bacterium]|nr:cardiolipin synthase [Alphaproteobacteria bacterium]MCB9797829.1 cardiolipin synthase [Alphaproteobacteria bacterium]
MTTPLLPELVHTSWPVAAGLVHVVVSALASGHVLLHKGSSRAAVGWFALVWLSPILGTILYVLLGINRVQRKALRLRGRPQPRLSVGTLDEAPPPEGHAALQRFLDTVVCEPVSRGNHVSLLEGGDATYGAMLDAIRGAQRSLTLVSYIFEDDEVGGRLVDALAEAVGRGVQVRVLVDGVGSLYSWPPVTSTLAARGVPAARFLWSALPGTMAFVNLRNHRKILVADGQLALMGGMNIRRGFSAQAVGPEASRDVHFRVEGPAVAELQQVFVSDWAFTTGERLEGEPWFAPPRPHAGTMGVRVVPDGPDEDIGRAELVYLAGLSCAERRVRVVTAYFLPEDGLVTALGAAARRGVEVDVVVPARSNLPYVNWAMQAELARLLRHGVRVHLSRPPFDHSKFMVVDDCVSVIGSSNWDPRSLRLNFELQAVVHGRTLAEALTRGFEARMQGAERVTVGALAARPLWVKLRDGAFRLWKPYL